MGSPSSIQVSSPFPDLGMAELSPLASGLNLNIGQSYDSRLFVGHSGNLNENSAYSPSKQSVNDNLPSPLIMPLDNIDTNSPSGFMSFNIPSFSDSVSSPTSANNNVCNTTLVDSKANVNVNLILMPPSHALSLGSVKQEVNTVLIKQEPFEGSYDLNDFAVNNVADFDHAVPADCDHTEKNI